ncbi:hypothetical protein ACL03H_09575 [Saccharopolyspora sp. MS10]|uniref:hypothetical protein n=1 Tax=Saccharopolyspora sp. MS10 TaxID=3385973 RepID=UPI00399F3C3E
MTSPADDDETGPSFAAGPNTVCFTCAGFRKVSEPRIYVIQATRETETGMTMGEWRTCPHCGGAGRIAGVVPPC